MTSISIFLTLWETWQSDSYVVRNIEVLVWREKVASAMEHNQLALMREHSEPV